MVLGLGAGPGGLPRGTGSSASGAITLIPDVGRFVNEEGGKQEVVGLD